MKDLKKFLPLFATVVLLLNACKKEDNASAITVEHISGTYKILSIKTKLNAEPEQDVTSDLFRDCDRDNLYKLNTDFSCAVIDAGLHCDPPSDTTITWALTGDTLIFLNQTLTITSFDGTTIKATRTETNGTQTLIVTFIIAKQ